MSTDAVRGGVPAPDPAAMRQGYEVPGLTEEEAPADPFELFDRWFADATGAGIKEPNAMTLATVDAVGSPDARVVLLKGVGPEDGFRFYTNKRSRKAAELAARAEAALVFYWDALDRSVRVRGAVEELDAAANDAYFASRPRGSRIGAWVSPQSEVIDGRGFLYAEQARREAEFAGGEVPRPPHWGGYAVLPRVVEFWQGQPLASPRPSAVRARRRRVDAGAAGALTLRTKSCGQPASIASFTSWIRPRHPNRRSGFAASAACSTASTKRFGRTSPANWRWRA